MKSFPDADTGAHLGNDGQDLLSRYVAENLAPKIASLRGAACTIGTLPARAAAPSASGQMRP
jgi:hypothetical protein